MALLFFEKESATEVSFVDKAENSTVEIKKNAQAPDATRNVIVRSQLALNQNEVVVIDSIRAGKGRNSNDLGIYHNIIKPILEDVLQVEHRYFATTSHTSIQEFASSFLLESKRLTVVIIGGDTSVNEFINHIGSTTKAQIDLSIIPAGTGNSLALSTGNSDLHTALQRLFTYTASDLKPLNIYSAKVPTGTYILEHDGTKKAAPSSYLFTVVVSWAFHASLVADSDSDEMRKFGIERFKVAAHNNLTRPQKYEGKVQVSDSEKVVLTRDGPFAYYVITPAQRFEPTFDILPLGDIFDEALYLITFGTEDLKDGKYIMDIMMQVYDKGKHIDNEKVHYDKIEKGHTIHLAAVNLSSFQQRRFCVDGAIVVLPEQDSSELSVSNYGNTVNGWSIYILT